MNSCVLDASVFVSYLRHRPTRSLLLNELQLFQPVTRSLISPVTIGELRALSLKQNWGEKRWEILSKLLSSVLVIDLNQELLFDAYAELDAYAENKHPDRVRAGSSNTVGKNDLWIAATALATNATLLTADKDFQIFDPEFFSVHYIGKETI